MLPAVHLVRKTATEVRFKLPIQLRLHQHHPQGIKASAGCCVLAVAFSFGRQALILRRQPTHHVLKLNRVQGVSQFTLGEFYVTQACSPAAPPLHRQLRRCISWWNTISNQLKSLVTALLALLSGCYCHVSSRKAHPRLEIVVVFVSIFW